MELSEVESALDKVREGLRTEGGDIELVEVQDGIVLVRLKGACGTCPMSAMTMRNYVESTLMRELPGLKAVRAV